MTIGIQIGTETPLKTCAFFVALSILLCLSFNHYFYGIRSDEAINITSYRSGDRLARSASAACRWYRSRPRRCASPTPSAATVRRVPRHRLSFSASRDSDSSGTSYSIKYITLHLKLIVEVYNVQNENGNKCLQ